MDIINPQKSELLKSFLIIDHLTRPTEFNEKIPFKILFNSSEISKKCCDLFCTVFLKYTHQILPWLAYSLRKYIGFPCLHMFFFWNITITSLFIYVHISDIVVIIQDLLAITGYSVYVMGDFIQKCSIPCGSLQSSNCLNIDWSFRNSITGSSQYKHKVSSNSVYGKSIFAER